MLVSVFEKSLVISMVYGCNDVTVGQPFQQCKKKKSERRVAGN